MNINTVVIITLSLLATMSGTAWSKTKANQSRRLEKWKEKFELEFTERVAKSFFLSNTYLVVPREHSFTILLDEMADEASRLKSVVTKSKKLGEQNELFTFRKIQQDINTLEIKLDTLNLQGWQDAANERKQILDALSQLSTSFRYGHRGDTDEQDGDQKSTPPPSSAEMSQGFKLQPEQFDQTFVEHQFSWNQTTVKMVKFLDPINLDQSGSTPVMAKEGAPILLCVPHTLFVQQDVLVVVNATCHMMKGPSDESWLTSLLSSVTIFFSNIMNSACNWINGFMMEPVKTYFLQIWSYFFPAKPPFKIAPTLRHALLPLQWSIGVDPGVTNGAKMVALAQYEGFMNQSLSKNLFKESHLQKIHEETCAIIQKNFEPRLSTSKCDNHSFSLWHETIEALKQEMDEKLHFHLSTNKNQVKLSEDLRKEARRQYLQFFDDQISGKTHAKQSPPQAHASSDWLDEKMHFRKIQTILQKMEKKVPTSFPTNWKLTVMKDLKQEFKRRVASHSQSHSLKEVKGNLDDPTKRFGPKKEEVSNQNFVKQTNNSEKIVQKTTPPPSVVKSSDGSRKELENIYEELGNFKRDQQVERSSFNKLLMDAQQVLDNPKSTALKITMILNQLKALKNKLYTEYGVHQLLYNVD